MIKPATTDDVDEIVAIFEPSFALPDFLPQLHTHEEKFGTGVGHARFEHVTTLRPEGFQFWVFQQNARARGFYEEHGAVAVEFTDGSRNEERTADVRYEWKPTA